jgi:hypothetical protein
MNNQEAFDAVATHLLKQGKKSLLSHEKFPGGMCAYRSSDGNKCAAGALIPDTLYDEGMEEKDILYCMGVYPELDALLAGVDPRLLKSLQWIHDNCEVEEWKNQLGTLAFEFGLEWEVLNAIG